MAVATFAAVTLGIVVVNDWLLEKATRANPASRVNWLYQSQPAEYEIAILGSSMAKEGIDPGLLAEACHISADSVVQLSWGGRGVSEQALYFELFLQRHKCKQLLLELHPRGLEKDVLTHPLDEFRYLARLDEPVVFRHVARQCGYWPTQLWRSVPMWGFAIFSTQIGWHDVLAWRRGESFEPNRIEEPSAAEVQDVESHKQELARQLEDPSKQPGFTEISVLSEEQFVDIVELCRKHNVQLLAFIPPVYEPSKFAPWLPRYKSLLGRETMVLNPAGDYLLDPEAFADALHVNALGRQRFTEELARLRIGLSLQ